MKIAFDSWALASRLRNHGTHVYAQNLITQFKQMIGGSPDLEFCLFTSPKAQNDANLVASDNGFGIARSDLLASERLWRLGGVSWAAAKVGADVIFSPTSNILPAGRTPVVCTIHDTIPVKMRVHSRRITLLLRSLLWAAARFSRAVITDSECSKRDLVEACGVPGSKISVVHLGYDHKLFNDEPGNRDAHAALLKRLGIEQPYVFHHGLIQPRKNLVRLIQAYRLMVRRNRNLPLTLVLAGRLGWEYEDVLAAAHGDAAAGKIILTGPLTDSEIVLMLKGAALVAVPSLYEGFCLPMVEAMATGAPTVAARSSCLEEISGGALHYFDPLSIEDMADCMESVLESSEARCDLVLRGKAQARRFSWERCARETLQVLRESCQN